MITIVDLVRGLSEMIEDLFGAPPVTKDLQEGFDRPCTFLTPILTDAVREGDLRHETVQLELVRFGARTSRGWVDLLHAQAALTEALERPVRVDNRFHLLAEETEFDLDRDDMVLTCTFEVQTFQLREEDEDGGSRDMMESLEMNGGTIAAP